ncbi:MAG: hypothetical protein HY315_02285, partial [Acidobacteria bacterium]|nr:hypothetical protein [Acidobacteriota bacterium]
MKKVVVLLGVFAVAVAWVPFWTGGNSEGFGVLAQDRSSAAERRTIVVKRDPLRVIEDAYPTFHGIAIAEEREELLVTSDSTVTRGGPSLNVYRTLFAPTNAITEPRRRVTLPSHGDARWCGVAVSPELNEVFMIHADGGSGIVTVPLDANGAVEEKRFVHTFHAPWGIFSEPKLDELFVTIEHVNRIDVFKRTATIMDESVRWIQGPKTQLADPHGIYVDIEKNEIYVVNHGNWRHTEPGEGWIQLQQMRPELRGKRKSYHDIIRPLGAQQQGSWFPPSGKFLPPSITVFSRTAMGDTEPLRVIQGSKTGMDLPLGIFLDTKSNQLVVANGGDDRVLFFDADARGDVAPVRVIGGPATGMAGPTGVVIDRTRDELWVSNWSNHTVTAYSRTAEGNVAPLR